MEAADYLSGQTILLDKPLTWSSFQAVNKLKYALKRKDVLMKNIKVGHAGTLDPLASGLLIVCVGKNTKKISEYQGLSKEYTGTIRLGATTPSYDLETAINQTFSTNHLTEALVEDTIPQFLGEIMQKPPIFSAIKKEGKRLYEHARNQEEVEIAARPVTIHAFEIKAFRLPEIDFRIVCSKGTYIRSIAHDLGEALKCGGHLTALRRTKIGDFSVEDAWQVADLEQYL
jgi:tRNA pseudouridine55 synthase